MYKGTIFRFPFRRKESELSSNVYRSENVDKLFHSFETQAHLLLLFCKTVEKIEIYEKGSKQEQPVLISEVCLTGENIRERRSRFATDIRNAKSKGNTRDPVKCNYNLTTTFSKPSIHIKQEKQWVVSQMHVSESSMSEKMRELVMKVNSLPLIGAAVCINTDDIDQKNPQGHVFCFQPLPLVKKSLTGLNIHINGCFVMDKSRRHIKLPSADLRNDDISDKLTQWNVTVINQLIHLAVIELLKCAIDIHQKDSTMIKIATIYSILPNKELIDPNWKEVVDNFYKTLVEMSWECLYTSAKHGKWVSLKHAYLLSDEIHNPTTIKYILLKAGIAVCEPPSYLAKDETLIQLSNPITPDVVYKALQNDYEILQSMNTTQKQDAIIYFSKTGNKECFWELALFEVCDGTFFTQWNEDTANVAFLETKESLLYLLPKGSYEHMILQRYPERKEYDEVLLQIAKSRGKEIFHIKFLNF